MRTTAFAVLTSSGTQGSSRDLLQATHLGMAVFEEVGQCWGTRRGGWWQVWCPQDLTQGVPLSPASLVPCPVPGDRQTSQRLRALDWGVKPWNPVPFCPATR